MNDSFKTLSKLKELDGQREEYKAKKDQWLPAYILVPLVISLLSFLTGAVPFIIMGTAVSIVGSIAIYHFNYTAPFKILTQQVKSELLAEFMRIYHPAILYKYIGSKHLAESIIENSGLITADRYNEEDAVTGTKGNAEFYLSEVNLENKKTDDNGTTYNSIFKGLLFKLKLKGRALPKSQLYSQPSMFKQWFGAIRKNEEFGFWYDTQDEKVFQRELQSLFPFIRHIAKEGEVRISAHGDEVIILMRSKMKFLDDPKFSIDKSFEDEDYYIKMSQQMNSLLYIIDSFTDELSPLEIEEKLKLRVAEYAEMKERFD
ncbi:MAG: hypothetical protein ACJA1A_000981 [Saprospiraceae bacterium]|jgi:hypothetical protein|tara:strand:- start:169 stop:1116 length:948 start_codon:yes stop_codon:yes gene_type:complete